MLGILIGVALGGRAIMLAVDGTWIGLGFGPTLLNHVVPAAVLVVLGIFFTKTAGVAGLMSAGGAAIAAVIVWLNGGGGVGFSLLLSAVVFWCATSILGLIATAKGDPIARQTS